jgi:hypothetical protein
MTMCEICMTNEATIEAILTDGDPGDSVPIWYICSNCASTLEPERLGGPMENEGSL